MSDLMQALYTYIEETCFREYLPREYYYHHQRALKATDRALHNSLSAAQWTLFEQYMDIKAACHDMELEALFRAAWDAARELG